MRFTMDAAGIASGQAFLEGELEKKDPLIREPLTSVTWPRDIPVKTGGGFVEFTSNFFIDYATAGTNEYGIIEPDANLIPTIQTNITKDVYKVHVWANSIRVDFVKMQKLEQLGRSLNDMLQKGLRLAYDKMLDQNCYFGFPTYGTYGLVNSPDVTAGLAPFNAGGTSRCWKDKTPQEVMDDLNYLLRSTWARSEYDLNGMANQILVPPAVFSDLNNRIVSSAGSISLLEYLTKYNLATAMGRKLVIAPCRQLIDAGTADTTGGDAEDDDSSDGSSRAVAYVNNEDYFHFDITVPLTKTPTVIKPLAYEVPYLSLIGQPKFLYTQCVEYMDGI